MHPFAAATLVAALLFLRVSRVDSRFGGFVESKGLSPPPGYKHTAFRLIVPEAAMATLNWHTALRHAAFLSLRRKISRFGDGSRAERTLWEQLMVAPVFPVQLHPPESEDADLSVLSRGLLLREAGHLAFAPEDILLHPAANTRKVTALWSVIRVRHSGPGLKEPQIEFYFTVTPASHLSMLAHLEKPNRVPVVYKGPFFGQHPGQFYHPGFINSYKQVVHNYIARNPEEEGKSFLQEKENGEFKQEPIYIIPSPRLVQPHFPKVANVAKLNIPEEPAVINLHVQKPIFAEEVEESEIVTTEKIPEMTTKRSSKYRKAAKSH
ncbi:uncharacterized protein LOC132202958 [Neocloeon triangulifer]|uniref:uncharacterized protein LOC132202958 n=1 Tax=Neocloeon triangulifer TaxID=2078957 RepID=UPI00286F78A8|nr:uncharacterized protein LOC132202958 [Neocloeon triangulifer]